MCTSFSKTPPLCSLRTTILKDRTTSLLFLHFLPFGPSFQNRNSSATHHLYDSIVINQLYCSSWLWFWGRSVSKREQPFRNTSSVYQRVLWRMMGALPVLKLSAVHSVSSQLFSCFLSPNDGSFRWLYYIHVLIINLNPIVNKNCSFTFIPLQ